MKKKIVNLLAVVLCFAMLLCGCQSKTSGDSQSQAAGTENSQDTEPGSDTASGSSESESEPDDADWENMALKDACSKYFTLGVGINGSTLDNLTTYDEKYMEMVKKHFNSVTMTNLMKSTYILQQRESQKSEDGSPALSFKTIDDTLQWCQDNGVKMRGHTLVWHTQTPLWFFKEGYTDNGAWVDKETMLFRMESYIRQLLEHVQQNYPGVIYCWDVVNEAVDPYGGDPDTDFMCRRDLDGEPNPWYETVGPEYVEYGFRYARKYADPDVKLFYNDFNTYELKKTQCIVNLCTKLKKENLIDGIGMQGYWGITYPQVTTIISAIKWFAQLDLEIHITELSIGVDEETEEQFERQAGAYQNLFFYLRSVDREGGGPANITNVTFFGLKDHYVEADKTNARLFDKNYEPKPAYDKVMNVFRKYYQK